MKHEIKQLTEAFAGMGESARRVSDSVAAFSKLVRDIHEEEKHRIDINFAGIVIGAVSVLILLTKIASII